MRSLTRQWLILLVVVGMVAGLGYWSFQNGAWSSALPQAASEPRPQPALTDMAAAPAPVLVRQVRAEANVAPVRSVELGMPVEGIVQDVLVAEGELVAAGQLLMKLKDQRQRVLVTQAQAELNRALAARAFLAAGPKPEEVAQMEAALAAAQANYDKLAGGLLPGAVAAAQAALAQAQADYRVITRGADPQELIEAAAQLELAQARINQASAAYNKVRGNPDIGMLPEALELQAATAEFNAAQARYELLQGGAAPELAASAAAAISVARAQLDTLTAAQPDEVAEAAALVQQAQAALDFVKSGARAEEIAVAQGDVDIATALLQDALVALAETELRAPFTGTVTALTIDSGARIAPDAPVIQLADLSAWRIETIDLTELDVGGIAPGDPVTITFDALPALALTGRVVRIRPVGETGGGVEVASPLPQRDMTEAEHLARDIVFRVVIAPDTHEPRLLWNMTALVDFGPR
jgi:HlyD family secretion protein